MIELTNSAVQTVGASQPITYNIALVKSGSAEKHALGSGQITLACPGRYLVMFSGNVALPTGGTVAEIPVALSANGESVPGGVMRYTPAAVNEYGNIATQHYIDVPKACGGAVPQTISVRNLYTEGILVDNPTLTAVRVNG